MLVGNGSTRNTHETRMHEPLVARVHALVDFVDDAEGAAREGLEGHEVEDGGDGAFAAGLAVRVEEGEGFGFSGFRVRVGCWG